MAHVPAIGRELVVTYRWNLRAFEELRHDPELTRMIDTVCQQIADEAGRGFEWKAESRPGEKWGPRYRGIVYTDTFRARVVNARDNTLLKALGGVDV